MICGASGQENRAALRKKVEHKSCGWNWGGWALSRNNFTDWRMKPKTDFGEINFDSLEEKLFFSLSTSPSKWTERTLIGKNFCPASHSFMYVRRRRKSINTLCNVWCKKLLSSFLISKSDHAGNLAKALMGQFIFFSLRNQHHPICMKLTSAAVQPRTKWNESQSFSKHTR